MPLLDSLLAFLLIVFAVSTVVTVLVQIWLAVGQARRRALEKMLDQFYQHGLLSAIRRQINDDSFLFYTEDEESLNLFLSGATSRPTGYRSFFTNVLTDLVDIDKDAFESRLRVSPLGQRVKGKIVAFETAKSNPPSDSELNDSIGAFFEELAVQFEVFGDKASDAYRRKARNLSFVLGIVVAVGANVDGFYLARSLIGDPVTRTAILATDKELVTNLKALRDDFSILSTLSSMTDTWREGNENLAKAITQPELDEKEARKALQKLDADTSELNKQLVELKKQIGSTGDPFAAEKEDLDAAIATVEISYGERVAMGWDHAPWCAESKSADCRFAPWSLESLSWLLGCIFTGLLAGLGAPFWHDLIKTVAGARKTVRKPSTAAS